MSGPGEDGWRITIRELQSRFAVWRRSGRSVAYLLSRSELQEAENLIQRHPDARESITDQLMEYVALSCSDYVVGMYRHWLEMGRTAETLIEN